VIGTKIWDALGKTDPEHTKKFSRSGGFKGTAVKPMWVYHRLTEQFGPVGLGWGHNKPEYQIVHATEGEVLVYCTVECWHTDRSATFYGVGGDKAVSRNKNGLFTDDEAFKKAFTDAVMNAFKSLGVAADIHMGLHDDDKYVESLKQEFAEPPPIISEDQRIELMALFEASGVAPGPVLQRASKNAGREVKDLRELPLSEFEGLKDFLIKRTAKETANA
jgi:uncharacterized short protein YbdD (DUF466 family)